MIMMMMMMDGGEYSTCSIGEPFGCTDMVTSTTLKKNSKNKNNKRFSDEQIRSLESMFESESRLEPRKKVQLAKELGLQPRQVAIWFQNKRARWKSKQLERDYNILRANYNNLASRYENLRKEKQTLLVQLQKLNELIQKPGDGVQCSEKGVTVTSSAEESVNGDRARRESDTRPRLSLEKSDHGGLGVISDGDSSIKVEYLGLEEEANLMSMVEPADGSMTSQEDWGSLDSDGLFDQPNTEYQWWDFWS